MDHSTAILDEASAAIDKSAAAHNPDTGADGPGNDEAANAAEDRSQGRSDRKRKGDFPDYSVRHGGRGGGKERGRGRGGRDRGGDNKRHKKGDLGRADYFRDEPDKRAKNAASAAKREAGEMPSYGLTYSKEEIDAEERKPKRKVAVMIGYAGTGYKGMQISPSERTIEGELFEAFIKAGAIAKANADDPKKASLVRCARTDKGVHAAGNMISLKLIVEDEKIVDKINEHLPEQIRVWGIERTTGSFSCYQACDSRWYEYLIPTHAFLPPHPSSFMAKQLEMLADEVGDREGYESRQAEVKGFWEKVDEEEIKPILETIDEDIRWDVIKALQGEEEASAKAAKQDADLEQPVKAGTSVEGQEAKAAEASKETAEEAAIIINEPTANDSTSKPKDAETGAASDSADTNPEKAPQEAATATDAPAPPSKPTNPEPTAEELAEADRTQRLRAAAKTLRTAYNTAKRRSRLPARRIERIQQALNNFLGTRNYHNYTIQKTYRDPSSKRNIKSFVVNPTPILIGEHANDADKSEWLSLKVHGQSFMMHQIRKMIGMVSLVVRCGSDIDKTMQNSFTDARYSIPKVPGLGLMLERPVFDSYNSIQAAKHDREALRFDKYEDKIEEFKRRQIYGRMFAEEERGGEFGRFFNHVDNFRDPYFLYVSSKGLEATEGRGRKDGYGEVKVGAEVEGGA